MKTIFKLSLTLLSFLFFTSEIIAVPASPVVKKIVQNDGSTLEVMLRGDEFFHFTATSDGIPLIKDYKGIYNYASINHQFEFIDLQIKAKNKAERTQSERAQLEQVQIESEKNLKDKIQMQRSKRMQSDASVPAKFPREGSPKSLVILVEYQDVQFKINNPQQAFTDLLNEEGYSQNGGTGSARDYFRESSMGKFDPEFVVVGPYTLPNEMAYYGANKEGGGDLRAPQMVIDAVKAAYEDGIDLSEFDTDNDAIIDNVFIYYAGYNEAEWGSENTIWPHRWSIYPGFNYTGSVQSTIFGGMQVFDYACSSELRSNSGVNMAGIGTFVHEFGHVLGLPDFYATNNHTHHTLRAWSVMDIGSYANLGRTPPGYSAYERFYLDFLTPDNLYENADSIILEPLNSSNKAFVITRTGNHNLNAKKPSPKEYFMVENRQKNGWDSFLPGKGMLIYRINFDQNKLNNNTANNDSTNMLLDLIEADKIADTKTYAGDPFPGANRVRSHHFTLLDGTALGQKFERIFERNGDVYFNYRKEVKFIPEMDTLLFIAASGSSQSKGIMIDFYNKTDEELNFEIVGRNANQFEITKDQIKKDIGKLTLKFMPENNFKKTAFLKLTLADKVQYVSLIGNKNNGMDEAENHIPDAPIVPESNHVLDITLKSFTATWNAVSNADYYKLFVYTKTENDSYQYIGNEPIETYELSYTVNDLDSEKEYFYYVTAVNDAGESEPSEELGPIKPVISSSSSLSSFDYKISLLDKVLLIHLEEANKTVRIFNTFGQILFAGEAMQGTTRIDLGNNKGMLIVQIGDRAEKLILR